MISLDSIEKIDRISELPEAIILHILSYLSFEDSARASVLSIAWKRFCSLNPILHFDHNLFALQSLVGVGVGVGEPDIDRLRDSFLDHVHDRLSKAIQLDSPVRKLALKVAFDDSNCFSHLDTCLELVKRIDVDELCVFVQSVGCLWDQIFFRSGGLYEFQISVLAVSKCLRSVSIRGCILADKTFVGDPMGGGVSFPSSIQRLYLSRVLLENTVFESLAKCCQGIETLVLDYCTVNINSIELSRFPKLKNALIEIPWGKINRVDIVDTNLECFKCEVEYGTICRISRAACASIREFTLVGSRTSITNQPSLFADLAATFPLVEDAEICIHDIETFKAVSNRLRKLRALRIGSVLVKEVRIDCPVLTFLECRGFDHHVQLHVDCPKLRVFHYETKMIPEQFFVSPMADLEETKVRFRANHAYDALWFVNLRAFLVLVMATRTYLTLEFNLPMIAFEPEQVEAIPTSPRYNVHLTLWTGSQVVENVGATVDAALFIIRPTTLIVCHAILQRRGGGGVLIMGSTVRA